MSDWLNDGMPFIDHVFDGKTGREIARENLKQWAAERDIWTLPAVQQPEKKKRGRPAKKHRPTFTFRLSNATRALLQSAADDSGRSLSEEVERRLEASINARTILEELLGPSGVARFLSKTSVGNE